MSDDKKRAFGRDGLVHTIRTGFYGGTSTQCDPTQYVSMRRTDAVTTCLRCLRYV